MSAVLESVAVLTPVAKARGALEVARGELAVIDERITAYQSELDEREFERQRHLIAERSAAGAGLPLPKARKQSPSDAERSLPHLREQRKAIVERVAECEGLLRRACVGYVEDEFKRACVEFPEKPSSANWLRVAGLHALLGGAGLSEQRLALSASFWNFVIPLMPGVREQVQHLGEFFAAAHAIAQGELTRAASRVRESIERAIGMKLPW